MSRELIVQNVVTTLFLVGAAWFVVRQVRNWRSAPVDLGVGDALSLVKVRHVRSGGHMQWGRATGSSGGRLVLGSDHLTLKWGLGFKKTEIEYRRLRNLRTKRFGLIDFVMFDIEGEDHYWVLGIRRQKVPALLEWLSQKGIRAGNA